MNEDISYNLYKDISERTDGEIYIGVVGPVRTGKSTFIKRFMEMMVLPMIQGENEKRRAKDELPQSGNGKNIMTTEPKFVPEEAVNIQVGEDLNIKVRLIDCVGYVVEGALGIIEDFKERMVKTPWFEEEIPFTKAAHIGTTKVIKEHSTIGVLVTTDGSFGELDRNSYIEAEKEAIEELKNIGKPFVMILNTTKPYGKDTLELAMKLSEQYSIKVIPCNCEQLGLEDVQEILKNILYEFPVQKVQFEIPQWVEMFDGDNAIMNELIEVSKEIFDKIDCVRDVRKEYAGEYQYISKINIKEINMSTGVVTIKIDIDEKFYYETISELTGTTISNQYQLVHILKDLSEKKVSFEKVANAIDSVKNNGYGFVAANREEISFETPEVIKNGNRYGVKISAKAPSIHMINTVLETELAPIVGTKEQAEELMHFIESESEKEGGIWEANILGKNIGEIIEVGINEKMQNLSNDNIQKIRDTLQKVMNENNGLVCLII